MFESEYKIKPEIEEQLIKNPYSTITNFAEERLKFIGRRTFQFLSLQPISLISPDIPFKETTVRTNFHFLLIAPPSSGKTSIHNLYQKVTFSPLSFQKMTSAQLAEELNGKGHTSLICSDADRIFSDLEFIKLLEGIMEEKTVQRSNMTRQRNYSTDCTITFGCVPNSLRNGIKNGLIQRVIPYIYSNTPEQQIQIGEMTVNSMFHEDAIISYLDVKHYYKRIFEIQNEQNDDFKKVEGYIIDQPLRQKIYELWNKCFEMGFPEDNQFNRELHDIFRFLCASAMLNMFTRKIENVGGKRMIVPNHLDFEVAKNLFIIEMGFKWHVAKLMGWLSGQNANIVNMYNSIKDNPRIQHGIKQLYKIHIDPRQVAQKNQTS